MESKLKTKLLNSSSKVKFIIPNLDISEKKKKINFLETKNNPIVFHSLRKKNFLYNNDFSNLDNFSSSSSSLPMFGTIKEKSNKLNKPPEILPVFIYDCYPPRLLEPIISVPYRGTPKYNTKRRLTNPILRRRSLSQSSICSAQSDRYQTPQQLRHQSIGLPSPSPSCMTMLQANNNSDYGTLKRYAPEVVQPVPRAGFE